VPIRATEDADHWADQRLEDVVQALEAAYVRHVAGAAPSDAPLAWTWERAARAAVAALAERLG
jgi:hypothetical protein